MLSTSPPASGVPIGTIIAYAGLNPAQWEASYWYECRGQRVKSTSREFSRLFSVVGLQYGQDGENFFLPDLRGMFLRGVGDAKTDPDIATRYQQGHPGQPMPTDLDKVGSFEDDAFAAHSHGLPNAICDGGDWAFSQGGWNVHPIQATSPAGGSTETRPKNVYVYFLIYAGPPADGGK